MANDETVAAAFRWIVDILHAHAIPFQITGGLAARVYGSPRPLNDIDIDVPEDCLRRLLPDVRAYVTFGPERYRDDSWDLLLLTLDYRGQAIDLGGVETTKVFDRASERWMPVASDFRTAELRSVLGLDVPVVHPRDLAAYKRSLSRVVEGVDIDNIDVEAVERFLHKRQ